MRQSMVVFIGNLTLCKLIKLKQNPMRYGTLQIASGRAQEGICQNYRKYTLY